VRCTRAAIEYARNTADEVALLDMMMPGMNGVESPPTPSPAEHSSLHDPLSSEISAMNCATHHPAEHFNIILTKPVRSGHCWRRLHKTLGRLSRARAPAVRPGRGRQSSPRGSRRHPLRIIVRDNAVKPESSSAGIVHRLATSRIWPATPYLPGALRRSVFDLS